MAGIGEYIKTLRQARNYSQRKLGYLSGVSNATINRLENNISMPDPDTLKKLAGPLGVSYIRLLNVAGYLSGKKFVPSNIKIIREGSGMTYSQLAEDIKRVTGKDISPETLENLEKGRNEGVTYSQIEAIAQYKGIDPEFLFRENTPEDLEYAVRNFPYMDGSDSEQGLKHIKDEELKRWVTNPDSLEYIVFAKKLSDLGVDPDFVYNEFVRKIFKRKKNKE